MLKKKSITTLSIAASTAFVASLAMMNVANAAESTNPFAMKELSSGYMQLAEAKCGGKKMEKEGKCGDSKKMEKEGKCGGSKKMEKEGKCGEGKAAPKAKKEGKCGEGKCGGK